MADKIWTGAVSNDWSDARNWRNGAAAPTVNRIYKFPLSRAAWNAAEKIEVPANARFIHVGHDGISFCVWAIVDPANPPTTRRLQVYGTGWEIEAPDAMQHVGTVIHEGYVWHVFEVEPPGTTVYP